MDSIVKRSLAGLLAILALSFCPLAAYATPDTTITVGPDEASKDLAAAFEAIPENAGDVVIEIAGNVHQKSTFLVSIPADKDISSLTIAARDEGGATIEQSTMSTTTYSRTACRSPSARASRSMRICAEDRTNPTSRRTPT